MPDSFYRSGQAAKQLGVSSYHLRRLCEAGEITAELTAGQQWRIPESEIARLRRQGVPDVPVAADDGNDDAPYASSPETGPDEPSEGLLAAPSDELIEAAEEVKIVESRLKKRRVEKEAEEVEDWFRDRDRRKAELAATERQKAEAARAGQRRRKWLDSWIQYALRSRPLDAPQETELEIHQVVQTALASLDPDQPRYITQRLVEAAVEKVLRPWKRKQEIRGALESAISRLPWDIKHAGDWAPVKQRALEAAAAAIGRLPADAASSQMEQVAWLAVQPMAQEHAQWQACRDLAASIFLPGGTYEENQQARQAVSETLARLPAGTSQKELEKTKESTLQVFRAAIQRRNLATSITLTGGTVEEDRQARQAVSEALARLPVGTSQKELENAKEATLAPFRAAIQQRQADAQERKEQVRRESEKARQLADIERRVDRRLSYSLGAYVRQLEEEEEVEFDDASGRWELEADIQKRIRPMVLSEVREEPEMSDEDIDELIDELAEEHIDEFLED